MVETSLAVEARSRWLLFAVMELTLCLCLNLDSPRQNIISSTTNLTSNCLPAVRPRT